MAELPQLPDEPVWLVVVAAIELLTRKKPDAADNSDSAIQQDSNVPLKLLGGLDPKDINYDLENNPSLRDQVLDLHKMAKSSGIYNGLANVALGLVVVLLFVGLVVGTKGGVIGAMDAIVPALGPFIYASILPVLVGIVASWKSQAILSDDLYPKIIEMLADPNSALVRAVTERRAFLEGREIAKGNISEEGMASAAAKTAPYTGQREAITPERNRGQEQKRAKTNPTSDTPEGQPDKAKNTKYNR